MKYFLAIGVLLLVAAGGIFLFENNREVKKNNDAPLTGGVAESGIVNSTTTTTVTTAVRPPNSDLRIPILMYHYIRDYNDPKDEVGNKLSVSPKKFDEQMKWLKDNGYETISLSELNNTNTKKPIVLTFDDGYTSAYTDAFPVLKKYNFTGTFYLISNYLNGGWYLTKDHVKEMDKAGMIFGAHTKNHIDLEKATIAKQTDEIVESKKRIEEVLGHPIDDFCYPSGKYSQQTIEILKNNGFKTATTVHNGIANAKETLFELPRIRVENNTNLAAKLSQ